MFSGLLDDFSCHLANSRTSGSKMLRHSSTTRYLDGSSQPIHGFGPRQLSHFGVLSRTLTRPDSISLQPIRPTICAYEISGHQQFVLILCRYGEYKANKTTYSILDMSRNRSIFSLPQKGFLFCSNYTKSLKHEFVKHGVCPR